MERVKQFLVDKLAKKWIKENKNFLEDYMGLVSELLLFKLKWGIEIGFIIKNPKEAEGRELGDGIAEELFNAQAKSKKDSNKKGK